MRVVERDIVSGVIESRDACILLVQKPHTQSIYAGKWCIPGGGMEEGESKEEALVRELREETSLDVASCERALVDTSGDTQEKYLRATGETILAKMRFFTYHVRMPYIASDMRVVIDEEHSAYAWVPRAELCCYDMPVPSVRLFRAMGYM